MVLLLMQKIPHKRSFTGFSLVELLVSIAISLLALAGIFSVFSTSIKASASNLREVALNQELRVVMDVMARDIRRAGYWSQADGRNINPFSASALSVDGGSCITYRYDIDADGVVNHNDSQGFKLVGQAVAIRKTSAACSDSGGHKWESISDLNSLNITHLKFVLKKEACINLTRRGQSCHLVPLPSDDKLAGHSGDDIEIMPVVVITLTGQLKADASVMDSLSETVVVRNSFPGIIP